MNEKTSPQDLHSWADNLKSKIQNRKWLGLLVIVFVLVVVGQVASAQQPAKIPRIGYFDGGFASTNAERVEAFRQGLRDLGYVEGKNILVEYLHSERNLDRLPKMVAELLRLNVDVIVAGGGGATTDAAKKATKTIPIVMAM